MASCDNDERERERERERWSSSNLTNDGEEGLIDGFNGSRCRLSHVNDLL